MYAMLCGYLPFEDPDTSELYKKIQTGIYEVPDHLSQDAQSLLKGILNVDPEARFNI